MHQRYLAHSFACLSLNPSPPPTFQRSQHASVPLLKEMLLVLDLARTAGSRHDALVADRLQRKLLHDDQKDSGLMPVLSRLIRGYNYRFQPRSHAIDLVETLHVVLCMLDRLASPGEGAWRREGWRSGWVGLGLSQVGCAPRQTSTSM